MLMTYFISTLIHIIKYVYTENSIEESSFKLCPKPIISLEYESAI